MLTIKAKDPLRKQNCKVYVNYKTEVPQRKQQKLQDLC